MVENKLGLINLTKIEIRKISKIEDDYLSKFIEYHKEKQSELEIEK